MTLFWITVPLMVVGIAIAALPVLIHSIRQSHGLGTGAEDTAATAAGEAAYWNKNLRGKPVPDVRYDIPERSRRSAPAPLAERQKPS
jgi:hypothetical protein